MSEQKTTLKPMFIVKPGAMARRDIRRAETLCGVVIVECADPESARYSEPPIDAEIDVQARAALQLMRTIVMNADANTSFYYKHTITSWFLKLLMEPQPVRVPSVKGVRK